MGFFHGANLRQSTTVNPTLNTRYDSQKAKNTSRLELGGRSSKEVLKTKAQIR